MILSATPPPVLLLRVEQESGYTRPVDAYALTCEITGDRKIRRIEFKSRNPDGSWKERQESIARVPGKEFRHLIPLLNEAETGPLVERPGLCDAGSLLIHGQTRPENLPFPILEIPDCGRGLQNTSAASPELIRRAAWWCKITY
jgi:hypothetical protein